MLKLATALLALLSLHAVAQTVTIDAAANRRPISPHIYGVGFASEQELRALRSPINRSGGNLTSRYNWLINAYNHDFDFYFESIGEDSAVPGDDVDRFIRNTRNASAEPIITVPMVGWVAKLGPNRSKLASFSIAKYGPQQDADFQFFPDAGNGVRPNGERITGNDFNDANVPADVSFQRSFVQHVNGTVHYYTLDNEPSLWHETHRDIHPDGQTLEEIREKMITYAAMIKSVDAAAIVLGPEEWGWLGYRFSGADLDYAQKNNYNGVYPDRLAHGDIDQVPWLLGELRRAESVAGRRLLDICAVHIYPQSGEFSDDVSPEMQRLRNRSTRSLWDRQYRDVSYIDDFIYLIPRMHEWVSQNYPGTKIAITEYNWGAENHINGATAQADIFGIFGREGLDLATRFTTPPIDSPTFKAMQMYRDFGDVSVRAAVPDPDTLSAFAAVRSTDGALTIMIVNKDFAAASPAIRIEGFRPRGPAQVSQLTAANRLERLADVAIAGNQIAMNVPAQSVTLVVVPAQKSRARAVRH